MTPDRPATVPEILRVTLGVHTDTLGALVRFYGDGLGLPVSVADGAREAPGRALTVSVGTTTVVFTSVTGPERPFYHLALLAPGDRFAAAKAWLEERVALLPPRGTTRTTVDFPAWDASACYWLDPAGSILELIAHHRLGPPSEVTGPFDPRELLGVSEVGLVVDGLDDAARRLDEDLGLPLWSGDLERMRLGFVGRQAHTLIVCPPARPWLPTGRLAEAHPVEVLVTAERVATVELSGAPRRQVVIGVRPGTAPPGM